MTSENEKLRDLIMDIENIAIKTLHSQPEGDEMCRDHLMKGLDKIADIANFRRKDISGVSKLMIDTVSDVMKCCKFDKEF